MSVMQSPASYGLGVALLMGCLVCSWSVQGAPWAGVGQAVTAQSEAAALLQEAFGFNARALDDAWQGRPVVRLLDSTDSREVAAVGAIGVRILPEQYLKRLVDIERFKRVDAVRQIGKFGDPPSREDVQDLAVEDADLRALRSCRLHDCDLQLPDATIRRAATEDWRAALAKPRASRLLQEQLLEQARAYAEGHASGGMVYMHRRRPVSVADEFSRLVHDDRRALPRLASLRQRLLGSGLEPGDFLYWSREKVARQVVLSLTHVVVDRPPDAAVAYAIGSKQLYASHYFYASLGLTLLLRDEGRPGTTLVVYMNRSRVDAFEGWLGGLTRRLVKSRASSAMREHLARLGQRLEPGRS